MGPGLPRLDGRSRLISLPKGSDMHVHPFRFAPDWFTAAGFRTCWFLLTHTNAVPVWFLWRLLRGEALDVATWSRARRTAATVAWAERNQPNQDPRILTYTVPLAQNHANA